MNDLMALLSCLTALSLICWQACEAQDASVMTKAKTIAETMMEKAPKPSSPAFLATAEEMDRAMHADSAAKQSEPLQFPKGNGLRILMTGHSFVAPAVRTLPMIAAAAGFDGHHQRSHNSGGSTGSATSIWLTEFGKFKGKPATPILLPALATGQWDVMTWGAYYHDTAESYAPWIDACLAKNPAMRFLIQDGWPMYPREADDADHVLIQAVIDAELDLGRAHLFQPLYDGLNLRYPGKVHLLPVAPAVVEMIRHYFAGELPGFDCLSEHLGGRCGIYRDGGHLSRSGGMDQIVGYVYYGVLYRQSPERVPAYKPEGVDPTVDRLMRKAAWKAVIHDPLSSITDKGGSGIAD
ncbi:MAG: signal peptide protein [Verrucomicrobiaceae bacterium]|nr:signal peptide protein [Verrucomicrobiaceae bacterium]